MTKEDFSELYGVPKQYLYSLHEERCHSGNAPTIAQIVEELGLDFCMDWVKNFLLDLQNFTSATRHLDANQLRQVCFIVTTQFRRIKVTEFMLFCIKAKSGEFGKFFNTIDPMDIITALRRWQSSCDALTARRFEEELRERERAERVAAHTGTITYEEALERGLIREKWRDLLKQK